MGEWVDAMGGGERLRTGIRRLPARSAFGTQQQPAVEDVRHSVHLTMPQFEVDRVAGFVVRS